MKIVRYKIKYLDFLEEHHTDTLDREILWVPKDDEDTPIGYHDFYKLVLSYLVKVREEGRVKVAKSTTAFQMMGTALDLMLEENPQFTEVGGFHKYRVDSNMQFGDGKDSEHGMMWGNEFKFYELFKANKKDLK